MRNLLIALGGFFLAACGGETMDPNDPLATYIPWDSTRSDVQTTESGLQYIIVREGEAGGAMPEPQDEVSVMYDGRLVDGTVFDSSYERGSPIKFGVGQVIPGWTEGLQLMSAGDEFVFYIPNDLAYGDQPRGNVIKAGDDLIFRVELLDVVKPPKPIPSNLEAWETYMPWDADAEGVQKTESGLQYVVLKKGDADAETVGPRDQVSVLYEGRLTDGTVFDSAYKRGEPSKFGVNQVIPGWTEGLQLMSVGDQFMFYIPSDIAYGDRPRPGGIIKPGDDLVFQVALIDLEKGPEPRPTDTAAWDKFTPWNSELPEVQKTGSGLEYVILASGDEAGPTAQGGDFVAVFYEGRLDQGGEVFDSAFDRGEAAMIPSNRVIPGWAEALRLMKPGDRWLVHVPGELAYGPAGNGPIPPNAALNFEVELMDVVPVQ